MKKIKLPKLKRVKIRRTWKIKPITHIKESEKLYDRNKEKRRAWLLKNLMED